MRYDWGLRARNTAAPATLDHSMTEPKRIVVGITGASGALYAQHVVRALIAAGVDVHLVVTALGQRLLHDELGMEGIDLDAMAGSQASPAPIVLHNVRDVGAPIASGSFPCDGMVIVPCSSNTLAAVAGSLQQNLVQRAAAVMLKERRRLVLVHRETPLALADIRNMEQATLAGAVVCPASPGFYLLPQQIDDLVEFMAARVLDLMGVEHDMNVRWNGKTT